MQRKNKPLTQLTIEPDDFHSHDEDMYYDDDVEDWILHVDSHIIEANTTYYVPKNSA
jgi:hypothetical protein